MTLYGFAKRLFRLQFGLMRWKVQGSDNIPNEGPDILKMNKLSIRDPVVAACSITRQVSFMAKEELFSIPILNKLGTFLSQRKSLESGTFLS